MSREMQKNVGWGDAAWISSIGIALVIVAVGIAFFVILILTSISLAKVQVIKRFFVNFMTSFLLSFLNLFLLFGAVFAFPAVVINSIATTALYYIDVQTDFKYILYEGKPRVGVRAMTYALIAVVSTISGACLIKYTPGVLHKVGEVPAIEWERDFQTWEGLGGWIVVNLGFGSVSLVVGTLVETWMFRRDALAHVNALSKCKAD